jgi:hypothetical protein
MFTLLLLNAGTGTLLALISLPLILRLVGPNAWYGFRVKATLDNADLWYDANAYAGWRLLVAGVCTVVSAIGLYYVPHLRLDQYSLGCLAISGTALVVALVQSTAYIRAHTPR